MIDLVFLTIAPTQEFGIYKNNKLIEKLALNAQATTALPTAFLALKNRFEISSISYINTPGSYMAIKTAYVFFKTVCMIKGYEFLAASGFLFNGNKPIKAMGKSFFVPSATDVNIELKDYPISEFVLPQVLDKSLFSKDTLPIYITPAVR